MSHVWYGGDVSENRHPEGLLPGDLIESPFRCGLRMRFTHTGIARLADAIDKPNPELDPNEPVRLVFGEDPTHGGLDRWVLDLNGTVRLVEAMPRKGER